MKYKSLIIIISIILFFIPFFWFAPGEMDLGGDSSRLYFYDPLSYLINHSLFGLSPSALGTENIGYYSLPFVTLLFFLKLILRSPTILICLFHGMKLSLAFLFCYLIVKELLIGGDNKGDYQRKIVESGAIIASLFYVFSPSMITGWHKALFTHDKVFLNPMMFFLLLRFFVSRDVRYFLSALLVSFVFASNFSYTGSPPFFAFYPITLLFLILYTRLIRKTKIPVKKLLIGAVLFVMIQAFHLIPQIANLTTPGTPTAYMFSKEGKVKVGLNYFSAIVPNIKLSKNLLGLPQSILKPFSWMFIFLSIIILLGFLCNQGKTFLLTGIFFLIVLFFASANITNTGLAFYKSLFNIPGFSMFRNFWGQWSISFFFFYTIFFGQALALVLSKIKKKYTKPVVFIIGAFLVINARSFINGDLINKTLHQSRGVKIFMKMDPVYEENLSFIRSLPLNAKVLTLPITDPGYQILAGKEGGAYIGPSTIAYLGGKRDFTGYEELGLFKALFLRLAKKQDYQSLKKILSLLNVKYIFHNSDPNIYEEKFPGFPYWNVINFMPDNQKAYEAFIQKLDVSLVADFEDKYHIYEIKDKDYLSP